MESVLDLWRLVDETPTEVQEGTHLMTPSGDAPEHSSKSPNLCRRAEKNEVPVRGQRCRKMSRLKDCWLKGGTVEKFHGQEMEINAPKVQIQNTNQEVPVTEASEEKPEENTATECKTALGNMTTAVNVDLQEVFSNQQRREALFQIERLLLRARPYDSIGFFYVQRELLHYLQLGEFQESTNSERPL